MHTSFAEPIYDPRDEPTELDLVYEQLWLTQQILKARAEEIKAAYERIAELTAELLECREYFHQRADADCDQDGFIPNEEMRRVTSIDECLHGPGGF